MGIRKKDLENLEKLMIENNLTYQGLSIMQFGDMDMRELNNSPALDYFKKQGCEIVSIDKNGKHGSLKLDLGKNIDRDEWMEYFDIVTNYGTVEHVQDDLNAWDNMYAFCKPGGLMITIAPLKGQHYKYHKNCHLYDLEYFKLFAADYNCEIITNEIVGRGKDKNKWIYCVLRKL